MAGVNHTLVFDVPLEVLWEVITNYEEYPEFVEDLESLTVTKRSGNEVYADYVVSMMGKTVKYTNKHTETPMKKLVWTMTEGEMFKFNNGGWELKAKGKDKVEATYTIDVGFPIFVPKTFVNMLTSTKLPSMMKAFEERALEKMKGGAKKAAAKKPAAKAAAKPAAKAASKGKKK